MGGDVGCVSESRTECIPLDDLVGFGHVSVSGVCRGDDGGGVRESRTKFISLDDLVECGRVCIGCTST